MAVYIPSSIHDFLPSWFNVRDYGAKGDGTTDDTAAFQACINAAVNTTTRAGFQCATVLIPASSAPYLIAGSPDGNGHILTIPSRDGSASEPQFNLRILGESPPQRVMWFPVGSLDNWVQGGCILKATYNSGAGYLLGAPGSSTWSGAGGQNWTAYVVDIDGLVFDLPSNPQIGGVDLYTAISCSVRRCSFIPGTFLTASATNVSSTVQPTHAASIALRLPKAGNGCLIKLEDLLVCEFYTGIKIGECVTADNVFVTNSVVALRFDATGGGHANRFGLLLGQGNLTMLKAEGSVKIPLQVAALSFEQAASGWASPAVGVDDSGNKFSGTMNYFLSAAGDGTFRQTGGTSLVITAM